jgi:hypothetical protein
MKTNILFFVVFILFSFSLWGQKKEVKEIEDYPIPKGIEQCFKLLDKTMSDHEKFLIKTLPEDSIYFNKEFQYGTDFFHAWELYEGSRLTRYFNKKGLSDSHGIYNTILVSYHRYLNKKEIYLDSQIKSFNNYRQQEHEEYLKKIQKDTIDGIYIPKNLIDCFNQLDQILSTKDIVEIRNLPNREETIKYHHGLGTWIRNNWGLWGGSRLKKYFTNNGFNNPDDMSSYILENYYDFLNKKMEKYNDADSTLKTYEETFNYINKMLKDSLPLNFKNAVWATEKTYYDDTLDIATLNQEIEVLTMLCNMLSNTELITYTQKDKDFTTKHAAIFKVFTDSILVPLDSNYIFIHTPYTYDFEDPTGQTDWTKMFVSKLLETGKGNCHSLPYLYKILADELGVPCYLAFAPNHIYIKLHAESTGWFNTELTSATFPIDAWIMASGYISLDAIRNGLYMDTLSLKQTIANCLVDLAHGYQRKFGLENPEFVIKCCNTVLEYHPVNVNAMLTKAEAQKHCIDIQMKKNNSKNLEDFSKNPEIAEMYSDMEQTYVLLHQLGYRRMPEKMYLEWVNSGLQK